MKFSEALKQLKEGKKVKRPDFDKEEYISLFDGSIPKFINTNKDNTIEYFPFDIMDFEAEDWEIYEEEDNWNWINAFAGEPISYISSIKNIQKTLKEKILEDFKEKIFNEEIGDEGILVYCKKDIEQILDKRFGF